MSVFNLTTRRCPSRRGEAADLPDAAEDAVVQLITYLIENETAALMVPARFVAPSGTGLSDHALGHRTSMIKRDPCAACITVTSRARVKLTTVRNASAIAIRVSGLST